MPNKKAQITNPVKLLIAILAAVNKVINAPTLLVVIKTRFLPKCCIKRVIGTTPQAVPTILMAKGKVDHFGSGVSCAPNTPPAKINIVPVLIASA